MDTKIFAHKGYLGIQSSYEAEGLENNPKDNKDLGFVVNAAYCAIQPAALEILRNVPKSNDDIGEIDVFKDKEGTVFMCWLGGSMVAFEPNSDISIKRQYMPELLTATDFETPVDFIDFVEASKALRDMQS